MHRGVCSLSAGLRSGIRRHLCEVGLFAARALKPILMIGPGTGVAPMRAFLQERQHIMQNALHGKKAMGEAALYFGCCRRDEDFIYEDEMLEYARDGTLTDLHTAFSRETQRKIYVQDHLRETAGRVWDLIGRNAAHVYVCGGTVMGNQVKEAVLKIVIAEGGLSADSAAEYMKGLVEQKRFIAELLSYKKKRNIYIYIYIFFFLAKNKSF